MPRTPAGSVKPGAEVESKEREAGDTGAPPWQHVSAEVLWEHNVSLISKVESQSNALFTLESRLETVLSHFANRCHRVVELEMQLHDAREEASQQAAANAEVVASLHSQLAELDAELRALWARYTTARAHADAAELRTEWASRMFPSPQPAQTQQPMSSLPAAEGGGAEGGQPSASTLLAPVRSMLFFRAGDRGGMGNLRGIKGGGGASSSARGSGGGGGGGTPASLRRTMSDASALTMSSVQSLPPEKPDGSGFVGLL